MSSLTNHDINLPPGVQTVTSTGSAATIQPTHSDNPSQPADNNGASAILSPDSRLPASSTPSTPANTHVEPSSTQNITATSTTDVSKTPSSGVSVGAVAGAAAGCFVGGIVLGIVVAWLLLRLRAKKAQKHLESERVTIANGNSIEPKGGAEAELSMFLLDGVADQEVATEVESLGELVEQHVDSNYHQQPIHHKSSALGLELAALGLHQKSALSPETIAALCIDHNTRQTGLRHVISYVLFKSIDFQSPGSYPCSLHRYQHCFTQSRG